jgi:hypothetical protein
MQFRRLGSLIALALLTACARHPAPSAERPSGPPIQTTTGQGHDAANDIARAYDRICLAAFPDEMKLQDELFRLDALTLSPADLHAVLPSDLGRGWRLPGSAFTVIVESSSTETCTIRRMTRVGLPTAQPYLAVVDAYARSHGLVKGAPRHPARQLPRGADGLSVAIPLSRPGAAHATETSLYEITNYHGRFDAAREPDAVGGAGVEIRLAHQLAPPA